MSALHLSLLLLLLAVGLGALWTTSSPPYLDRIVIISRHGDRAPLVRYPWDGDTNRIWRHGYGHLTKHGKQRMYRLGVYLRYRYSLLYKHRLIKPRDLYIRSSGVERCLETAQLLAAGLSPPRRHWPWNANLGTMWQPVPVHSWPREQDGLLVPSSLCRRAVALYGRIPDSTKVKHFIIPFERTLELITNQSKVPIRTYREARSVYDSVLCARHHLEDDILPNFLLFKATSWLNADQEEALKTIFEMSFQFDFTGAIEPELRRLRTGLLLTEIFSRLEPHSAGPKLNIYTTHDSQLFHLLDALGLRPQKTLKFGATLIFEATYSPSLNETSVAVYSIEVKKSTDYFVMKELSLPVPGSPPEPDVRPTLAALKRFYAPLMLRDMEQWRAECSDMSGLDEEKFQRGKDEL